uniref:ANF_receptor domain-containing protein n=1 Tax=Caenorhabditis japonica TaxID=281687 RepID=A0A8R1IBG6_CAEJA
MLLFLLLFHFFQQFDTQITERTTTTTPVPPEKRRTIRVGVAAVQTTETGSIGWATSGGAVNLAIEKLRDDGFIAPFDFEFYVNYTECDSALGAAVGVDFMRAKNVDAMIGPPCQNRNVSLS